MKTRTYRLSGADKVAFIVFNYQDKETETGITNRSDEDAKYIRSFVRRGFLSRKGGTWKFTKLGNAILRKISFN